MTGLPKNKSRVCIALILLNLVFALWSMFVFLVLLRLDLLSWLMVNVCSPTQFLSVAGLLSDRKTLMNVSVPLLLYFGLGGMFLFSWSGHMFMAQLSHLVMTATALYIITESIKTKEFREMLTGLGIGALIVASILFIVFPWYYINPDPKVLEMMTEMGFTGDMG